jgi:hypothetical protein
MHLHRSPLPILIPAWGGDPVFGGGEMRSLFSHVRSSCANLSVRLLTLAVSGWSSKSNAITMQPPTTVLSIN